jgi:4'-phosphopantetheinyl transferase
MSDDNFDQSLFKKLRTEVHVWFCKPEGIRDVSRISAYKSVLSVQETERYERFHYDKDRHNYLVSHALLRHALSKYADVSASQWQFTCNAHGKPELSQYATPPDATLVKSDKLRFNLTHTEGLCACVMAIGGACGIDAENVRRKNSLKAVAQRMFAEEEMAVLDESSDDCHRFYDFWTLREAYVKALGTGLAGSSKDYYFSLNPGRRTASLNFKNRRQDEKSRWQFSLFEPTDEHRLAVAFESAEPMSVHVSEFVF